MLCLPDIMSMVPNIKIVYLSSAHETYLLPIKQYWGLAVHYHSFLYQALTSVNLVDTDFRLYRLRTVEASSVVPSASVRPRRFVRHLLLEDDNQCGRTILWVTERQRKVYFFNIITTKNSKTHLLTKMEEEINDFKIPIFLYYNTKTKIYICNWNMSC